MTYRVFYRTKFDGACPAKPDYEADYERGADVDAASWVGCAESLGATGVVPKKGARMRRPLGVGDVLVGDDCEARILTDQAIWARVPMPKQLTARDFGGQWR